MDFLSKKCTVMCRFRQWIVHIVVFSRFSIIIWTYKIVESMLCVTNPSAHRQERKQEISLSEKISLVHLPMAGVLK